MSSEFLSQNQQSLDKIKQQKREWYYRNRKSVLRQQKKSEKKKEYLKGWYQKNRTECIGKSREWILNHPTARQSIVQKYVHKNSARTRFWKPYAIPTDSEMEWIENFGQLQNFDATNEKLSKRLTLEIADLKESSKIIKRHHYLHRGRTMSQLPYWICIDGEKVGVLLYSLPRVVIALMELNQ